MRIKNFVSMLAISTAITLVGTSAFAGDALDRIMGSGVLKVATDANWAPQSFINDNNEMDGFDVAVATEIAKRLGVEVEFVTPSWDIITAGNWSGRWDMSVGSMTPTKTRAEVLSFPAVYYYTPAAIAVHKDSPYKKLSDLNGEVIGASTASTYELYLQKDLTIDSEGVPSFSYKVTPGEIRSYKDSTAALDDLRLGDGVRINAIIGSLPSILSAIESNYPVRVLGDPVFFEPLAVALDRGDSALDAKVATIVKAMRDDGTLKTLSTKWYGLDYTSAIE